MERVFTMPELGENIESGDVVNVLVKEGDHVKANQAVVEMETEKAVIEVPCPHAGRVKQVHVQKRQTVPVGAPILTVETEAGAEVHEAPTPPKDSEEKPVKEPATFEARKEPAPENPTFQGQDVPRRPEGRVLPPLGDEDELQGAGQPGRTARAAHAPPAPLRRPDRTPAPAAPATRRFARELGVDLNQVDGTGPGGRITREDVIQAVRQGQASGVEAEPAPQPAAARQPAPVLPVGVEDQDPFGKVRREPLTKIRKTIAANMARSSSTIPHVTNFDDADITELERIRKGSMADYVDKNVKLTMMAFVTKAVAHALKLHPHINASLDLEREEVIYKDYVNVGIAVDTERGLIVPVLRNVDRLSIPQIAQQLASLAERARGSQFKMEDLRGGTFTISNLGAIGGTYSTPIINPPEVAILLVGRSRQLPVVVEDQIKPRLLMPLSLSYDHRWVDGATAARFLNEVIGFLENPGRLLLAP